MKRRRVPDALVDRGPAAVPLSLPEDFMRPIVRELTAAIVKEIRAEDQALAATKTEPKPAAATPVRRRRSLRAAS